jgi:hypothetical protein
MLASHREAGEIPDGPTSDNRFERGDLRAQYVDALACR